jgi:hypothetical protein
VRRDISVGINSRADAQTASASLCFAQLVDGYSSIAKVFGDAIAFYFVTAVRRGITAMRWDNVLDPDALPCRNAR